MSTIPLTISAPQPIQATQPLRVLICEPQLRSYGLPYLPPMYGVLKTFLEQHSEHHAAVEWADPIHEMAHPDTIERQLKQTPFDVLGLSCYTWNWRLQREIAKRARAINPNALIVAGGPEPNYKDTQFFDKNPWLDAVVVKDGEIPFTRILERALRYPTVSHYRDAGLQLNDIPGLVLPTTNGTLTAPAEIAKDANVSHYLAQRDYYERFINDHPGGVAVAWETSRGCPFQCSYCDWGSATMSKVRRFDLERLYEEIDWFAQMKVQVVFSVDSNFGMFKTDVNLTDALVEAKNTHGYPKYFVWSNAKNVPSRTIEITRKVINAGLETSHTLSIQHTDDRVLEATDRKNISTDRQIDVVRTLQADGVPISAQLILGLPEDNPRIWRKSFTDMMEWGVHDGHIVTNYHLLPNAPAAAPEYRERWGLQTVDRYIYDGPGSLEEAPIDPLTFPRGEVVIAAKSFDTHDWVQMNTDQAILRGLHNSGYTQLIARFLRASHAVPYNEFYTDLIDTILPSCDEGTTIINTIKACVTAFVEDESHLAMIPLPGDESATPRLLVEPHRYAYAAACLHIDELFSAINNHLTNAYPDIEALEDAIRYQKAVIITSAHDYTKPTAINAQHNWPAYFQDTATISPADHTPTPEPINTGLVIQPAKGWDDDSAHGDFTWQPTNAQTAQRAWFECLGVGRLSAKRCTHQTIKPASDTINIATRRVHHPRQSVA